MAKHQEKPKMTLTSLILLLIIISFITLAIGVIVWGLLKPKPEIIPDFVKMDESKYQAWTRICDDIAIKNEEQIFIEGKTFPEDFITKCQGKIAQLAKICQRYNTTVPYFLSYCRSIGAARNYYKVYEKQTQHHRSIFPTELLPKGFEGEVPTKEPVFTEQDYKKLNAVLAYNIKLYQQDLQNIEAIISGICPPPQLLEEDDDYDKVKQSNIQEN